jgi:hypothetical protein
LMGLANARCFLIGAAGDEAPLDRGALEPSEIASFSLAITPCIG